MNTKIDWHYHLSGRNVKKDVLNLTEYLRTMDEVYVMASYFPENGSGLSNYNLYYHLKDIEKTKLYLSLDFEHYFFQGFNEMVSILEEDPSKIIGIKIYTGYQNIDFSKDVNNKFSNELEMVLELARKYNLYIMFHTGYLKGNKEMFNPKDIEDVININSDINFILAHLSNPYDLELIQLLNMYDNLYTDISGLVDKRKEIADTIKYVQNIYKKVDDKSKFLFGTDYPMQNHETTLNFV